ncbi:MAG: hypothetical protein H6766_07070 [Candidatus Peribacteria bacterium]|nr:MAG: hypothetical protein H6766_07070 [Candidatus Peribacteria bacterium]
MTPSDDLSRLTAIAQDRQSSHDEASYDTEAVTRQQEAVITSLDTYRTQLASVQTTIDPGSMDSVLALLDTHTLIPVEDQSLIAEMDIPASFDTVRTLNPAQDYLTQQQKILVSYQQDINANTAQDLALTEQSYDQMRTALTQTKALVA